MNRARAKSFCIKSGPAHAGACPDCPVGRVEGSPALGAWLKRLLNFKQAVIDDEWLLDK
jgi:hypothetical protein